LEEVRRRLLRVRHDVEHEGVDAVEVGSTRSSFEREEEAAVEREGKVRRG